MDANLAEADQSSSEPASGTTPEPPVTPEPEAAPAVTAAPAALEQTTPAHETQERVGSDVDSYEAMVRAALAPAPAASETEQPQGTPAEEPTPEATVEQEAPAPVETTPPAAPVEDEGKIPDRIRITGLSERDRALTSAAVLLAKANKISVAEAMAIVSKPAESATTDTPETPSVRSEEQIKADIAAKRAAKKEAAAGMDTAKMVELDEEIDALRDELDDSRRVTIEARTREEIAFDQEVNASKAKAAEFYGEAAKDPNSALSKRAVEIANLLEEQGNDLIYQANAPLKVYQMAANDLGIAPITPGTKPAAAAPAAAPKLSPSVPTKPAPVKQVAVTGRPVQPAVTPASGAATRTSPQPNGSPGIDLDKIQSPHDYEKVLNELTGRR